MDKKSAELRDVNDYIACLEQWISKNTSLYMPDFFSEFEIPWGRFCALKKKYLTLDNFYNCVRFKLAKRLIERILMTREELPRHQEKLFLRYISYYDLDIYDQMEKTRMNVNEKNQSEYLNYIVEGYKKYKLDPKYEKKYVTERSKKKSTA